MRRGRAAAIVVVMAGVAACGGPGRPDARPDAPSPAPPASASPSPAPSPEPVSPSPKPPPTPSPSRTGSPGPRPSPTAPRTTTPPATRSVAVFRGLGTWVDAFDFSREYGGTLSPAAVDAMAAQGVRTLYLQAAREDPRSPELLLSSDLLGEWLERAHARGIEVVAWYLPTFVDPDRDWAHLQAILGFRSGGHAFDALGVDIESKALADAEERGERLVALSARLRAAAPRTTLQAIVLPPVVTDVINPSYWPGFPWRRIAAYYDVWSPMAYWTNRTAESGWRDAYRYTAENVRMTRANLGRPGAVVHVVGGIGDETTAADVDGFARAARDQRAIGGSLYDYATTRAGAWPGLRRVPSG